MAGQRSFFTHDVFLSLCGSDTRHGFADNLLRALHDRGISTFINEDEEGLLRGEEVTPPALVKAIKESRMAIIVFSENYVASSLCYIVESFQPYHQFILPVYYDVDPSDVRHQRGTYGEVLARLEEEEEKLKGNNKEKVRTWRNALFRVANLSGWNFKLGTGYHEFEILARIVEEVCNRAPSHAADEVESIGRINVEEVSNRAPLLVVDSSVRDVGHDELESYGRRSEEEISDFALSHVADYMVGLEPQMEEMMSLLELGSDEVHMVGISGMGE